jgi:hypothetical protein
MKEKRTHISNYTCSFYILKQYKSRDLLLMIQRELRCSSRDGFQGQRNASDNCTG